MENSVHGGCNILINCSLCGKIKYEVSSHYLHTEKTLSSNNFKKEWKKVDFNFLDDCLGKLGWKRTIDGIFICDECYKEINIKNNLKEIGFINK